MTFPTLTAQQIKLFSESLSYKEFMALKAIYEKLVAMGVVTAGLATEATLDAFKTENDNNLDDANATLLVLGDLLDETDAQKITEWLRAIWRTTKDWDNTGLTVAQLLVALNGTLTGWVYGQSGTATPYDFSDADITVVNAAIAAQINTTKANHAKCVVYSSGIVYDPVGMVFHGHVIIAF